MKKLVKALCVILLCVPISLVTHPDDPDALWKIVNQHCSRFLPKGRLASPCLKFDAANHFAIIKDKKGGDHFLLIPTVKLHGIEDKSAVDVARKPFFYEAWESRGFLPVGVSGASAAQNYSFALNSAYGRTQNQFHVHLSCLSPKIYKVLEHLRGKLGPAWTPLPSRLNSHIYIARTLPLASLGVVDPIQLLRDYAQSKDDDIAKYGLNMIVQRNDQVVLLATRYTIWHLNFGAAEELQDSTCALIKHR